MAKNHSLVNSKLVTNRIPSMVLRTVRELAPVSRSRLAHHCGLSMSAISRTVNELLDEQLLTESSLADSHGARRKDGLCLNRSIGYCLSVSYGEDGVNASILDTSYAVLAEESRRVDLQSMSKEEKIATITDCLEELQSGNRKLPGKCLALAVVDPGVIDKEAGVAIQCSTLRHWHHVPIAEILEQRFKLPVMLINGSLACIQAVDRLEMRGVTENLIYIQYGAGVGCCMKLGGHYVSGHSMLAGEFGHWRVSDKEIQCRCGGTGCLEAVAALPALVSNVNDAIRCGSESTLANHAPFDGNAVLEAAAKGDRLALRVVCEAFDCLGQAVGGLINTLAPTVVLFEDVVGRAGPDAVAALFQSIRRNALPSHSQHLDLRISTVESSLTRIACLGGAAAALDYCLEY